MSRFLALPRELRDEICDHTLGPCHFTNINYNKVGVETYRTRIYLPSPKGRLASSAPSLFLVNHQIHAKYMERYLKTEPEGPQHADIIYEFPSIDLLTTQPLPPDLGSSDYARTDTHTISISVGPEWGSRLKDVVEDNFAQVCVWTLRALRMELSRAGADSECKAVGFTMIVRPDEYKPEEMKFRLTGCGRGQSLSPKYYRKAVSINFRCIAG